jgi:hypothetical protein
MQAPKSPSKRNGKISKAPPMQLDLLSSEMLGNLQFRSLQSLPQYDRLAREHTVEKAVNERAMLWHHPKAFKAAVKSTDTWLHAASANQLEAWVQPEDGFSGARPGRGRMDDGAKKISSKLFVETWPPHAEFGRSLEMSHGV